MTAPPTCNCCEFSMNWTWNTTKQNVHIINLLGWKFWCCFLLTKGYFYFHLDTEFPLSFHLFILSRENTLQFDIYLKVESPPLLLVITCLLLLLTFVPGKVIKTKPLLMEGNTVKEGLQSWGFRWISKLCPPKQTTLWDSETGECLVSSRNF